MQNVHNEYKWFISGVFLLYRTKTQCTLAKSIRPWSFNYNDACISTCKARRVLGRFFQHRIISNAHESNRCWGASRLYVFFRDVVKSMYLYTICSNACKYTSVSFQHHATRHWWRQWRAKLTFLKLIWRKLITSLKYCNLLPKYTTTYLVATARIKLQQKIER